jgi:L-fuconolactonase
VKIDSHQHYWHYVAQDFPWISADMPALQQDCQPTDVLPALHSAGVEAVLAVQARSRADETGYLLGLAKVHPQIVGVVGWTDLCAAEVSDTLDAYANQPLLKGFRHILQDEPQLGAFMRQPAFSRGVKAVQARGLVYDVLVFDWQISAVVDFCARHNRHWLVLDHVGKPCVKDWWTKAEVPSRWLASLRALAAMPHVMCKLSGLVTEATGPPLRVCRRKTTASCWSALTAPLSCLARTAFCLAPTGRCASSPPRMRRCTAWRSAGPAAASAAPNKTPSGAPMPSAAMG